MHASSPAAPALEAAAEAAAETAAEATVVEELKNEDAKAEPTLRRNEYLTTPTRIRYFTDVALKFLSNASNETLGACAIGLCASTYLVLGRVGLVLIGTVAGVALHATWESSYDGEDDTVDAVQKRRPRRRELGIEVARRLLDWKARKRDGEAGVEGEGVKVEASVARKPLDYTEFRPATAAALTALTDAIIRDYVK
jgi:hypothetical protein